MFARLVFRASEGRYLLFSAGDLASSCFGLLGYSTSLINRSIFAGLSLGRRYHARNAGFSSFISLFTLQ